MMMAYPWYLRFSLYAPAWRLSCTFSSPTHAGDTRGETLLHSMESVALAHSAHAQLFDLCEYLADRERLCQHMIDGELCQSHWFLSGREHCLWGLVLHVAMQHNSLGTPLQTPAFPHLGLVSSPRHARQCQMSWTAVGELLHTGKACRQVGCRCMVMLVSSHSVSLCRFARGCIHRRDHSSVCVQAADKRGPAVRAAQSARCVQFRSSRVAPETGNISPPH